MAYSDVKPNEERDIVVTLIVRDGLDTGIARKVPGYLITKLEMVLEEIKEYSTKGE